MGFMPLAINLPMSFTQQLDKQRKILKHTECTVSGWTLHPDDVQMVANSTAPEVILAHLPLKIYVKKSGMEQMPQHFNLPPQVYAVSSKGVNWELRMKSGLWIRRFGFPLRPDFASTVHAVTGSELDAAIVNLGDFCSTPRLDENALGEDL